MAAGTTQPGVDPAGVPGRGEEEVHLSLWRVIRRRRWRIVAGVVVGLALGLLYGVLTGPWYESTAQILVIKKQLETAPISGPNREARLDDYLSTHMLLITSPRVVERAVKTGNLETLSCFSRDGQLDHVKESLSRLLLGPGRPVSEQERVTKEIVDSLVVSRDAQKPGSPPSNEVMNVAFRGNNAGDCNKVLSAVIASYESFLKETYRDVNEETLKLIERARDVLKKDLDAREGAYRAFLQKAPPEVLKGKEGSSTDKVAAQRTELRTRRAQVQALLEQIDDAVKKGRSEAEVMRLVAGLPTGKPILSPDAEGLGTPRGPRSSLEEELINLRLREKDLLRRFGEKHPEVLAVRERIESVQSLITPPPGSGGGTKLSEAMRDLARMKIDQLKEEFEQNKRSEKALDELLHEEQVEAKAAVLHTIEAEGHRQGIERSKALYDSILKRVQELNSVSDYGGFYTQEIASPGPGQWVLKKILLTFGLSLFLGLLLGFGSAYRVDVKDRSFRKPEEIHQALGWRVLGHIPVLGKAGKEEMAEAIRAVRTALYFSPARGAERIIQVTGPDKGAGKTTLTAHLAASIAQSGKRVLVVDADLRRPCQHKIYSVANDLGLTTVLTGRAGASEAIRPTPIPGLWLLPSGPPGPNPAELLSSPRLGELLGSLRELYDYVLIDTPPLLAVTDSSIVAHHVDGVLLVIRLTRRSRPNALEAKKALEAAGAEVLGVVVNGVPRRSGPDSPVYECYPLGRTYTALSG